MPNTITVTPAHVRASLDASLTEEVLSDAVINLELYAGAVIREVKRRDPEWTSRTNDDARRLDNAADLLTAASLVFVVPWVKKETFGGSETYERQMVDLNELVSQLTGRAESEIDAVVSGVVVVVDDRPTIFGLACGRRGA